MDVVDIGKVLVEYQWPETAWRSEDAFGRVPQRQTTLSGEVRCTMPPPLSTYTHTAHNGAIDMAKIRLSVMMHIP